MQKGIFIPTFLSFALSILFLTVSVTPSYAATCSSPDGEPGAMIFNKAHDAFQGCTPDGWMAFHKTGVGELPGPSGCPTIADVCSDGTIYVGLTPDGNVPLYTTSANLFNPDASGGVYSWNNGGSAGSNFVDTAMPNCANPGAATASCKTGKANTTFLVGLTDGGSPYKAAKACEDLSAHGYSDWYLPAVQEVQLLFAIKSGKPNGYLGFLNGRYWSSSEYDQYGAWHQDFVNGTPDAYFISKNAEVNYVRCVRQDNRPPTTPPQDNTPDSFAFASKLNQPLDQFIGSNVVTIAGIGPDPVALSIAGEASARVSVNDAPWEITTTIKNGDKLQLFLRSANAVNTTYTATVTLGTFSTAWSVSTKLTCPPSPMPGDEGCRMGDGSLYAGKTPDGNHDIFTTPDDAPSALTWNNGGTNYLFTGMSLCDAVTDTGCITGRSNTSLLAGLSNADSPYAAAKYCQDSTAHSKGDWYLPSRNELNVLYTHSEDIGNFVTESTMYYWSSSEIHSDNAWVRYFGTGAENPNTKHYTGQVRCIRNDSPEVDITPNSFAFTDVDNQPLNTLVTSNTVTINGLGAGSVYTQASGSGSPQININGGGWVSSGFISNGQTLQVRMTSAATVASAYPVVVLVGNLNSRWTVTTMVSDHTPDAFTFTDLTEQAFNTLVTSNIVTITGLGPEDVAVNASGDGSPQISINGGPWVTSGTILNNQTLQTRVTTANVASTAAAVTVVVGSVPAVWNVTTGTGACTNAGDICADGTIYAGLTPDGNVPMYTTPADGPAGGDLTGTNGGYTWNDGSANWVDTALANCDESPYSATACATGRSNSATIAAIAGASPAPYKAAQYCENLTANGHSDWYLPARNELSLLRDLHVAGIGGFLPYYYWSSSEYNNIYTWIQYFENGQLSISAKSPGYRVRCVRSDAPPPDEAPDAFTFTDLTGQALNVQVTSNTATITGLGSQPVAVSVSGAGSPQISINGGAWVTSGTILNNQTLQTRLTTANAASTAVAATVVVGTLSDVWNVTTGTGVCTNVGDICADGTIYAGLTPDGNVPMFAMPTDGPAGGYVIAPIGGYNWDDGSGSFVDTALANCDVSPYNATACITGRSNSATIAAITGASPAPYKAAQYCENLTANGHSDWYLPARNELSLLYTIHQAGKGGFVADLYWASSEFNGNLAWGQDFATGSPYNYAKLRGMRARCVRAEAPSQDDTPDAFSFTDVTGQALNVIIPSNTVTINGIGPAAVAVSVAGANTPEFSVNGGAWRTAATTISNGQTLQVRLRSGMTASNTRSATVTVGTASDQWDVTAAAVIPACTGTLTIGQICPDGTIYAGVTPDGNSKMFTTPADATGGTKSWNNGVNSSAARTDTPVINCVSTEDSCKTGRLNTAILEVLADGGSPYVAAKYCADLTANGHSDWYLPAKEELKILSNNRPAIGTQLFTGGSYWSSTEENQFNAYRHYLNGSNIGGGNGKYLSDTIRCVRNENAAPTIPDYTPDSFSFTSLSGQQPYTTVESGTVTITGLGSGGAEVSAEALAGTAFSINGGSWITAGTSAIITNGQTLKLRGYTDAIASTKMIKVTVGTATVSWSLATLTDACAAPSPATGTECEDGTFYAGTTELGSKMFAAPSDGQGSWNNGSLWGTVDTMVENCGFGSGCDTGRLNTLILASLTSDDAPYAAAKYCADLNANGHTDWYLPAKSEMQTVVYASYNFPSGAGLGPAGYWTSSELDLNTAVTIDQWGNESSMNKSAYGSMRCVRNENPPPTMPDTTPDNFTFDSVIEQAMSATIDSKKVTITGLDSPGAAVTTNGYAMINVNGTGWVYSGTIVNGQTLQLRVGTSSLPNVTNPATVTVGTLTVAWNVTTTTGLGCSTMGQAYTGGYCVTTGSGALVVATEDVGPDATSSRLAWGSSGTYRGQTNTTNGLAATNTLAGYGAAAHPAAYACWNSTASGFTDWYLPSRDELFAIYSNRSVLGNNYQTNVYWTATESDANNSWSRSFSTNYEDARSKGSEYVRCVRREAVVQDNTPDAFDFGSSYGGDGLTTSPVVTITGIGPSPVAVNVQVVNSGGNDAVSINGGPWVTSGNISNGQTLQARMIVGAGGDNTLNVIVGTVTGSWSVRGSD